MGPGVGLQGPAPLGGCRPWTRGGARRRQECRGVRPVALGSRCRAGAWGPGAALTSLPLGGGG